MNKAFPPPEINQFERLQIKDGISINAELWRKAHDYHDKRQSVQYQSLNQPGIVFGLGVRSISAPEYTSAQYRDGRWLQIEPGIAIDLQGNPIVVPELETYRIASENRTQSPITIYLVIKFVNPETLNQQNQREILLEDYSLDEKTSPANEFEVELCRIVLQPLADEIQNPVNVFFPEDNSIDLRYRQQARSRTQAVVNVAQINHSDSQASRSLDNLSYLLESVNVLYPFLAGTSEVSQLSLQENNQNNIDENTGFDLLYLTGQQDLSFKEEEFENLKNYIDTGSTLLIEIPTGATEFANSIEVLVQKLGITLEEWTTLNPIHPLRRKPFLFAALPSVTQRQLHIFCGMGIIVIAGDLSPAWGLDEQLSLDRNTIRTAQELGINILHFAWHRRHLMHLLQQDKSNNQPDNSQRQQKLKNVNKPSDLL
ncbi:MAG: DUF4159 domain-containing protein [Cyanobacteria bacterium J06632_19]